MTDVFNIDLRNLKWLEAQFKNGPKIYGRAAAVMFNEMAFRMKNYEIINHMQRRTPMIVRNKAFAQRQLRVKKARPRSNLSRIMSEVGSVAVKKRFTGWAEQEGVKKSTKTRTMALKARGGQRTRKARPSARLRPGKHPRPGDLGFKSSRVKSKEHLAKAWLVWTRRERYKKPFVLLGHDRISDGLLQWRGKKLIRLQYFAVRKRAAPERVQWLRGSQKVYMRSLGTNGMLRLWRDAIKRVSNWK
jgi:hypothetical protein